MGMLDHMWITYVWFGFFYIIVFNHNIKERGEEGAAEEERG